MRTTVVASLTSLLLTLSALPSATAGTTAAEHPWLSQRVMNMAHSGGEDEAPMNTLYAFEEAEAVGADMLELDVQRTEDGDLAVIHDGTVDDSTDHTGAVDEYTMDELRAMDAAHWFVPGRSTVHDEPDVEYPLRGARHGDVEVEGHAPEDFGVPSLSDVLERFPDTPVNIEIKGSGTDESFLATAETLAGQLEPGGRTDLIVGSFSDVALARFHELAPEVPMSAGQDAMTAYFLAGTPLPEGVVALQVPITHAGIRVVTRSFVDRAHEDGYAVHAWFSGSAPDDAETYGEIVDTCVDGLMPSRPSVLEDVFTARGIERPTPEGTEPRAECVLERPTEPGDPGGPDGPEGPGTDGPQAEGPGTDGPQAEGPGTTAPERPRVVQTDGWVSGAPAAR